MTSRFLLLGRLLEALGKWSRWLFQVMRRRSQAMPIPDADPAIARLAERYPDAPLVWLELVARSAAGAQVPSSGESGGQFSPLADKVASRTRSTIAFATQPGRKTVAAADAVRPARARLSLVSAEQLPPIEAISKPKVPRASWFSAFSPAQQSAKAAPDAGPGSASRAIGDAGNAPGNSLRDADLSFNVPLRGAFDRVSVQAPTAKADVRIIHPAAQPMLSSLTGIREAAEQRVRPLPQQTGNGRLPAPALQPLSRRRYQRLGDTGFPAVSFPPAGAGAGATVPDAVRDGQYARPEEVSAVSGPLWQGEPGEQLWPNLQSPDSTASETAAPDYFDRSRFARLARIQERS